MQPIRKLLEDGRWHFHHGPIDLVISVDGELDATDRALTACWQRFAEILPELAAELSLLRQPIKQVTWMSSPVARRMVRACWPHRLQFITPMAAVAGAVADELIGFFAAEPEIRRASINNGGDIALHLQPGERFTIGRGRSMSLGIADSVTVLAQSAAMADAAATMIANAVNAQHEVIRRAPASTLKDDTDLGDLLVTTHVGPLPAVLIQQALDEGAKYAQHLLGEGLIFAAALTLQGQSRLVGRTLDRLVLQARRAA